MNINIAINGIIDTVTKALLKKQGQTIIIGKKDRTLTLLDDTDEVQLIPKKELIHISNSDNKATLKSEVLFGNDIVTWLEQLGTATIEANTTSVITFNEPFPTKCYQVQLTHVENDTITSISAKVIDNSSFQLTLVGGVSTEKINWCAKGY